MIDPDPNPTAAPATATRRGAWVLFDQGLSSLTNFGLSVMVLRAVGPEEFGAFTIVLMTYFLALYLSRALAGDSQLVRHSHVSTDEAREATRAATGVALLVGLATGLILAAASALLGGLVGSVLLPLAVVMPGLMLQDAWRYAFFARGAPFQAFLNDLLWAAAQVALVGWVVVGGDGDVRLFVLAWGGAATMAAVVGSLQAGARPRPRLALSWLSANRDLSPRLAAEVGIALAAWQLTFYTVGAVAGLAQLGILNAARVILGPFNAVALGATGFAIPEGTAIWRRSPERLAKAVAALGAGLAVVALACTGAALLLPDHLGTELLGTIWPDAKRILPLVGLWVAAEGAGQGPRIGMMVLGAPRTLLATRAVTAPLILAAGALGALWGGARGAALGLLGAHALGTVIWWCRFHRLHRRELASLSVTPSPSPTPAPAEDHAPLPVPELALGFPVVPER